MNDWDSQWNANRKFREANPPSTELTRFGVDTSVTHTTATPVVVKQGGGLSNGMMLLLSGFAIGILWGEPIINKLLGTKRHEK